MEISVKELFEKGRSSHSFSSKKVPHELLEEIYDLMKLGSTSYNCCPLRMVFVEGDEDKKKLIACAMDGNIDSIKNAPMTVLFAYDMNFAEKFTKLLPNMPQVAGYFQNEEIVLDTAFRNSTL
ncbi:MAG: hypothetical protein RLZZ59_294 [Pseudomonadota bacterium]|jgi:3-hydroxypropanoate dehydrogenase